MVWTLSGESEENFIRGQMLNFENQWNEIISDKKKLIRDRRLQKYSPLLLVFGIISFFILGLIAFAFIISYFLIYGYLHKKYSQTSKDFMKIELAKKNNWLYSPQVDRGAQSTLAQKFPDLFKKGNTGNKYVEDQFFGTFKLGASSIPFHFGNFYYEIRTQSKDHDHTTPYPHNFFGFKLNKSLNKKFRLKPEGAFSGVGNFFFGKKDIDVESIKFNKEFAFKYDGPKEEMERTIVKLFVPSLQLKFVNLEKKKRNFEVLFDGETVIFMFNKFLIPKIKTNYLKHGKISEEDVIAINQKVSELTEIMEEIIKSMD